MANFTTLNWQYSKIWKSKVYKNSISSQHTRYGRAWRGDVRLFASRCLNLMSCKILPRWYFLIFLWMFGLNGLHITNDHRYIKYYQFIGGYFEKKWVSVLTLVKQTLAPLRRMFLSHIQKVSPTHTARLGGCHYTSRFSFPKTNPFPFICKLIGVRLKDK